jgi:hypothetical protein
VGRLSSLDFNAGGFFVFDEAGASEIVVLVDIIAELVVLGAVVALMLGVTGGGKGRAYILLVAGGLAPGWSVLGRIVTSVDDAGALTDSSNFFSTVEGSVLPLPDVLPSPETSLFAAFLSFSDCIHSVQLSGISSSSRSLSVTSAIGFNTLSAHLACMPIHITSVSRGTQSGSVQDTSVTITCTLSVVASLGSRCSTLASIAFLGFFLLLEVFFFEAKLKSIAMM